VSELEGREERGSEAPPAPSPAGGPVSPDGGWHSTAGVAGGVWGPGGAALGIVIAIGLLLAGTIAVAVVDPDLESVGAKLTLQLFVAVALIATAGGFALSTSGGDRRLALRSLGARSVVWKAFGLAIVAWLAYVVISAVLSPLLQPEQQDVAKELTGESPSTIALVVTGALIVVAAPVSEELFFRGFLFAGLRKSVPFWLAALLSAAFWALLHLGPGNIGVVYQLGIFGLVLAGLYERTGSIWPCMLAHVINNSIAFAYLLSQT
jgi:membrane protease YdiL (CAAX protease family)